MFSPIFMPLALVLQLVMGAGPVLAQGNTPPPTSGRPTSPDALAVATTDRAAGEMARLQRQRAQKLTEKRSLERTYESQLRDLDRLKRSRASWRRDREIRSSKAESQTTAERLSRADAELRAIEGLLRRQRQTVLAAVEREVALGPDPARRALLDRMRAQVTDALQPRVRKILVPDDTLDELADPEELAEQIALIQQAEAELRSEREALRQREDRYVRMARLREQRERASQMNELEEELVRRTGGRSDDRNASAGTPSGSNQEEVPPPPPGPSGGEGASPDIEADSSGSPVGSPGGGSPGGGLGSTPGGNGPAGEDVGFEQSSILLTDVVDSSTIDALRRAGRSSSPRARAQAATRARVQVEERLQRFERNRLLIQRHLGKLRQGK